MREWFVEFGKRYPLPTAYTALDLETTGLNPEQHLIVACGMLRVEACRPVGKRLWLFNWPEAGHDCALLEQQLEKIRDIMGSQGKCYPYTVDLLRTGMHPVTALQEILAIIEEAETNRHMLVMHNGVRFDTQFLRAHWHNELHISYQFDKELVYDTGMVEKACQLGDEYDALPLEGEALWDYWLRIGAIKARGVKWALDSYCEERYGLLEKTGFSVLDLHRADNDALMLHTLVEQQRALMLPTGDGE